MSVKIRLSKTGSANKTKYRVIAVDESQKRDGRAIEILGYYDPTGQTPSIKINSRRIDHWVSVGAKKTAAVEALLGKTPQK